MACLCFVIKGVSHTGLVTRSRETPCSMCTRASIARTQHKCASTAEPEEGTPNQRSAPTQAHAPAMLCAPSMEGAPLRPLASLHTLCACMGGIRAASCPLNLCGCAGGEGEGGVGG